MKEVRGEAPMSIPQPDLFTNPNDLQRNTLQLQTRIVQSAWTDSWKIWNPGSSQIRPRFWHKYSWKWVLWANGQTGGGAKSALALDWIDLERFWQCKSLNWHLCESKKVCKYGATMHIEGSRSLWRKNYLSGGVRSSNWLSSQLENLTRCAQAAIRWSDQFSLTPRPLSGSVTRIQSKFVLTLRSLINLPSHPIVHHHFISRCNFFICFEFSALRDWI